MLAGAIVAMRVAWVGSLDAAVVFVEGVLPAGTFAVLLLAALWVGPRLSPGECWGPAGRAALGCGVVGFVLHNLVTYSLWTPAAATVFWIAAACAAAAADGLGAVRLPRAGRAMISDAVGTVVGAATGTSTVTSYIESATGVAYGARTGLANLVTGGLFLAGLFFTPLVAMVGKYPPITAPALVVVGAMMVRNVMRIDWKDFGEAIPAFLAMVGIPLTFSIADGLALGFVSYPVINVLAGRWRRVSWMMYLVAAVFIMRYLLIRV